MKTIQGVLILSILVISLLGFASAIGDGSFNNPYVISYGESLYVGEYFIFNHIYQEFHYGFPFPTLETFMTNLPNVLSSCDKSEGPASLMITPMAVGGSQACIVAWAPTSNDIGTHQIKIRAVDLDNMLRYYSFNVEVLEVEDDFDYLIGDGDPVNPYMISPGETAYVGVPFSFENIYSQLDYGSLNAFRTPIFTGALDSCNSLNNDLYPGADGLTANPVSGTPACSVSWTPTASQVGEEYRVIINTQGDFINFPGENGLKSFAFDVTVRGCGDGNIDVGEQCDGNSNGVVCDNSVSSCNYCNASCSWVTLPYDDDDNDDDDDDDDDDDHDDDDDYDSNSCEPNWQCSSWTSCQNSFQTRTCRDTNYCGFAYGRPNEKMGCDSTSQIDLSPERESAQRDFSKIALASIILGVLVGILLLIVLVVAIARR